MAQLEDLQKQLNKMKTELAIAQNKFNEAATALGTEYGVTIDAADEEYDAITKGIIPQLALKRDNVLAKAQAIMEGIEHGESEGSQTAEAQNTARSAQPNDQGRGTTRRQIVGRKLTN